MSNQKLTQLDTRQIKRGECTKCSCKQYEREVESIRAACAYCECPAPLHSEIIAEVQTIESPQTESNTSCSTSLSSSGSDSINQMISFEVSSNEDDFLHSLLMSPSTSNVEPSSDDIEKDMPQKLPRKLEIALQTRNVTPADEDKLVQIVVQQLYSNKHDSNKCMEIAARKIIKKYSPLKKSLDPQNRALVIKLMRRRNRLNQSGSKDADKTPNPDGRLTPEQAIAKMKVDWGLGNRNASNFRANMAITRAKRKGQSVRTPALQLCRMYPALNLTDVLMEEFEIEVGMKQEIMVNTWKRNLPFIVDHMLSCNIDIDRSEDIADQTFSVLKKIHLLPLWYKKTKADERAIKVLEAFPENSPPEEMKPKEKDSPRLICSGLYSPNCSILCYVDGQSFFSEHDPFKSLLLLFAAYFVLSIKWGTYTRLPLVFLFCAAVGVGKVANDVSRNNKLGALLKDLHII